MNRLILALLFLTGILLSPVNGDTTDTLLDTEETPDLTTPDSVIRSQIYMMDRKVQAVQIEIQTIKAQLMQALKDNKLEQVKELTDKTNQLEKNLKDTRIELDILISNHQRDFANRPWWRKLMIEIGPQYTYFDNDLKINDVAGARLRIHLRQDTFGRYHSYPFIGTSDSPIRDITSSPFIFEYRNSIHEVDGQTKKGRVDTYLAGFGLSGQLTKKSFIHLSILGGVQDYSNMEPEDLGLILSYSMGLQRRVSDSVALGLIATEDWVMTKATQSDGQTNSFFNFSLNLLGRVKF
ncbi:MAG: hypothetical protein HZA49_02550 [Planctomycetes bacterium]|nr:hypothetical protein [Planctomycetota bacterium]